MVRGEIELRNDLRHHNLLQLHEAFETHGEIAFVLDLYALSLYTVSRNITRFLVITSACALWILIQCLFYSPGLCREFPSPPRHNIGNTAEQVAMVWA